MRIGENLLKEVKMYDVFVVGRGVNFC